MSDNSKIIKNSGFLYVRLFISTISSLIITRLLLKALGVSDFGLYSVVSGIVVMMGFLNTVMISTTNRYIAYEIGKGDNTSINQVFNISLIIHLSIAILLIIFSELFGVFYIKNYLNIPIESISDAVYVFRFSVFAAFFSIVSIPFQGLITAYEKFFIRASLEVLKSLLQIISAVIVVYYLGSKLRLYSALMVVVMLIPAILFVLYSIKKYPYIVKWKFQRKKEKYFEMLNFSGWIMLGAGASVGKVQGTAIIINLFFGQLLNASFGIASQINNFVLLISKNLGQAAIPQIIKSYSSGNETRMMTLVAYVSKNTYFIMLIFSLPLLLETKYLLTLWLGNLPQYTVIFSQLMIVNALIDSLGSGIPAAVQATGKIKYFQIVLSTTSLASLPIAYYFFSIGSPAPSIMVVFITTSSINVIVRQLLLKKIINFDVKYFLKTSYLKVLYVSILISPLLLTHNFLHANLFRVVFHTLFAISWLLIVIYFFGIDKKEKEMILQLINKRFKR